MKVTLISIVIGTLGTVTKGLVQGLEDLEISGRVETIQTTTLLRPPRILKKKKSWRLVGSCCHADSSGKPSANAGTKNTQMSKIIIDTLLLSLYLSIISNSNTSERDFHESNAFKFFDFENKSTSS